MLTDPGKKLDIWSAPGNQSRLLCHHTWSGTHSPDPDYDGDDVIMMVTISLMYQRSETDEQRHHILPYFYWLGPIIIISFSNPLALEIWLVIRTWPTWKIPQTGGAGCANAQGTLHGIICRQLLCERQVMIGKNKIKVKRTTMRPMMQDLPAGNQTRLFHHHTCLRLPVALLARRPLVLPILLKVFLGSDFVDKDVRPCGGQCDILTDGILLMRLIPRDKAQS